MSRSSIGKLRLVGKLEGLSFLVLLFIAMPLKYVAHMPMAVRVTGMVHGVLFLGFLYLLFEAATEHDWPLGKSAMAFLASLVPFGPFVLDRRLAADEAAAAPAPVSGD